MAKLREVVEEDRRHGPPLQRGAGLGGGRVVSKRLKARARPGGTLVLDTQGLSPHVDYDEKMRALIAKAESEGSRVAVSSVTPLEVRRSGEAGKRLEFLLSRFDVKPVSDAVVALAAKLLDSTGRDGHACLVDALVVATAALCAPPVRLATSDRSHIPTLCQAAEEAGFQVRVLPV